MGSDTGTWWLDATTIGCIATMGGVVAWRLTGPSAARDAHA
jgi:hypothetical protein